MFKFFFHIRILSIFFLLFSSCYSFAQYDEYNTDDTVVDAEDYFEGTTYQFNDVDTANFKVDERKVADSTLNSYKNSEEFWYSSFEPKKPKAKKDSGSSNNNNGLRSLLWFIIVGSFVVIIIWFISSSTNLFRKKSEKIWEEDEEEIHQDIFAINYEKEISKAKTAQNYRLAIRLFYLQLLKTLSDSGKIQYKQEKTNSDYLMQLFESNYYNIFFKLTRNFEYTWYGHFSVTEDAFVNIEKEFKDFKSSLPS